MTPEQEIRSTALSAAAILHAAPSNKYGSEDSDVADTAKSFATFIETGEFPSDEDEEDDKEADETEEHPAGEPDGHPAEEPTSPVAAAA